MCGQEMGAILSLPSSVGDSCLATLLLAVAALMLAALTLASFVVRYEGSP